MKLCPGRWSSNYKTGVSPLKQSTRTKIKTKKIHISESDVQILGPFMEC